MNRTTPGMRPVTVFKTIELAFIFINLMKNTTSFSPFSVRTDEGRAVTKRSFSPRFLCEPEMRFEITVWSLMMRRAIRGVYLRPAEVYPLRDEYVNVYHALCLSPRLS